MNDVSSIFKSPELAIDYLQQVRTENPRYIRDQLFLIKKLSQNYDMTILNQTLDFCLQNKILKATDFESVAKKMKAEINNNLDTDQIKIKTINKASFKLTPQKSNISDYNNLMK